MPRPRQPGENNPEALVDATLGVLRPSRHADARYATLAAYCQDPLHLVLDLWVPELAYQTHVGGEVTRPGPDRPDTAGGVEDPFEICTPFTLSTMPTTNSSPSGLSGHTWPARYSWIPRPQYLAAICGE